MQSLDWFRAKFPEDLYPCSSENQVEYIERVLHGHEIARNSTCVIAGLVRDCEQILPATLVRIQTLCDYFFDCNIIIFENDSIDYSKEILIDFQNSNDNVLIQLQDLGFKKHGSVKTEARIKDMAYCRSRLQKLVHTLDFEEDIKPDYVILMDMDIEGGFSYEGVLHSLTFPYDCVASNSLFYEHTKDGVVRHYYDSYGLKLLQEENDEFKNRMLLNRGEPLVKVHSAFGGLAVYKYDAYMKGKYAVGDWEKYCEHIPFHSNMSCYVNPSQITLYSKSRYSI